MLGSYAILGKKYAPFEFFIASLLVAGMVKTPNPKPQTLAN